jgi:hypothetical protein
MPIQLGRGFREVQQGAASAKRARNTPGSSTQGSNVQAAKVGAQRWLAETSGDDSPHVPWFTQQRFSTMRTEDPKRIETWQKSFGATDKGYLFSAPPPPEPAPGPAGGAPAAAKNEEVA